MTTSPTTRPKLDLAHAAPRGLAVSPFVNVQPTIRFDWGVVTAVTSMLPCAENDAAVMGESRPLVPGSGCAPGSRAGAFVSEAVTSSTTGRGGSHDRSRARSVGGNRQS